MIFDAIPVGQIDTNCYLIGDEKAVSYTHLTLPTISSV